MPTPQTHVPRAPAARYRHVQRALHRSGLRVPPTEGGDQAVVELTTPAPLRVVFRTVEPGHHEAGSAARRA